MQKYKFFINVRKNHKNIWNLIQKVRNEFSAIYNLDGLILLIQNNPEGGALSNFRPFDKDFTVVVVFDNAFGQR